MHFSVKKIISQKKTSPFKGLVNVLILIIAIPVIVIAAISLSLYFAFLWIKNKIFKEKNNGYEETHYHLELDLIHNEQVHIVLIEDELDAELMKLNEAWQEKVYDDETYLYRTKTTPLIPALEGSIACFYYKEQYNGLFLQLVPAKNIADTATLHSQLVFLNYENFHLSIIDETGAFFLYNDNTNERLIKGFNKQQEISLELLPSVSPNT